MAQIPIKLYRTNAKKPLQVIFTSSQTYTIPSGYKSMDVFLVGGGGKGGDTAELSGSGTYNHLAGGGGGGGYAQTFRNINLTSREISVSVAYSSAKTNLIYNNDTANPLEVNNGGNAKTPLQTAGGDGGSGGGAYGGIVTQAGGTYYAGAGGSNGSSGGPGASSRPGGSGQGTTTRAFEETNGTLFAGGGGGGSNVSGTNRAGGDGGGGSGSFNANGVAGSDNTGGGGGGAGSNNPHRYGGAGGSGIAIIRLYPNSDRPTDIDWANNTINL